MFRTHVQSCQRRSDRACYVVLVLVALATAGARGCGEGAGALKGLRAELPCAGALDAVGCKCPNTATDSAALSGSQGTVYEVTLRIRGVTEQKTYTGGTADGSWYAGGGAVGDGFNIYKLTIQEPAQTYFLNAGSSSIFHCFPIDYTRTVRVAAGSTVTLSADAGDGGEVRNVDATGAPIVIAGVPPAPQPFDGQFVQVDVVSISAAR